MIALTLRMLYFRGLLWLHEIEVKDIVNEQTLPDLAASDEQFCSSVDGKPINGPCWSDTLVAGAWGIIVQ